MAKIITCPECHGQMTFQREGNMRSRDGYLEYERYIHNYKTDCKVLDLRICCRLETSKKTKKKS